MQNPGFRPLGLGLGLGFLGARTPPRPGFARCGRAAGLPSGTSAPPPCPRGALPLVEVETGDVPQVCRIACRADVLGYAIP